VIREEDELNDKQFEVLEMFDTIFDSIKVVGHLVTTNMQKMLHADNLLIGLDGVFENKLGWWLNVAKGLSLQAITAPLCYELKIPILFLPATLSIQYQTMMSMDPRVTNFVTWADTICVHDSFEFTRQEKLKVINNYSLVKQEPVYLYVCQDRTQNGNCCRCKRCALTIMGLVLAGADPEVFGFYDVDLDYIRSRFASHLWGEVPMRFGMSQEGINEEDYPEEVQTFIHWFKTFNFVQNHELSKLPQYRFRSIFFRQSAYL